MKQKIMLALVFALAMTNALAMDHPVRDARVFAGAAREQALRVRTARVIRADYALLRRDFGGELAGKSDAEVDHWLLDQTGFIARTQARQLEAEAVNTTIDADAEHAREALRPDGYGRGYVFRTGSGFIDGKGFGSLAPSRGSNRNGLMPLEDAIREMTWEKTIHRLARDATLPFTTVGTYAVIDWGFDIIEGEARVPAGAVLRQAHRREGWNFNSNLPREEALAVELALRRFGVTTSGMSESLRRQARHGYDLINVQGARSPEGPALVDFGTYVRMPENHVFTRPIAMRRNSFFSNAILENRVGGNREVGVLEGLIQPGDPDFVARATNEGAVPATKFQVRDAALKEPESDAVAATARALVQRLRAGAPCEERLSKR
jgi:hypothetical protein